LPDSGFPRRSRIIKTDDFSSVFNFRKRISGQFLSLHYQYNQLGWPRLGLNVGKKAARLSVQRNYMKRILREMFRNDQHNLPSLDIIIRAQKLFGPSQYKLVESEFRELISRLQRQTHQRITPISS
jgi:ribonuclease P protein component